MEMLEGIASLTTSAIVNARLMQELRDYGDQQRILYEMGQQIAAGLNLQDTLTRVLQWIGRLFETEVGLLWLTEQNAPPEEPDISSRLRLVAALGVDLPPDEEPTLLLDQGITGWVARTGETVLSNEPATHPFFDNTLSLDLNLTARNLLAVPMVYHDQTIGVICLLNKIGSSFTEADLTLLSTVIDMVAVAVGNARLHTRTLTLMAEKERLSKQILHSERLATVGRLTASLSHEINNPMQAIQGALTLALEELGNPAEVDTYLRMSLQESERVVKLINRLRQIYRPQAELPETLDLNRLLQEAATIARKELKRQKVSLKIELADQLPPLTVIANQIHLVFLSLILNLSDAIGTAGGGPLHIRSSSSTEAIEIEFSTRASILSLTDWELLFRAEPGQDELNSSFGLSLSYDIIASHGASIKLNQTAQNVVCRLEFPLSPPDLPSDELGL
jgi:nitrogen-specific signal transduction histidine kinase